MCFSKRPRRFRSLGWARSRCGRRLMAFRIDDDMAAVWQGNELFVLGISMSRMGGGGEMKAAVAGDGRKLPKI